MIHPARIHRLNYKPVRETGRFVLYWMQQSQRAEWNHALEYAVERANRLNLPLAVVFGITARYPDANERHLQFMLEGLQETVESLRERGIGTFSCCGHPPSVALEAGAEAALIVCDQGYLRHQAEWRADVAAKSDCEVVEVESDIVVPVETASDHAEYMARTLRPKLLRQLDEFLQPLRPLPVRIRWASVSGTPAWFDNQSGIPSLSSLKADGSTGPVSFFKGGSREAENRLRRFIRDTLADYPEHSNQPQTGSVSTLSPYLHFGQISPLQIALEIQRSPAPEPARAAFLEQLIVRRELAINFVWFQNDYDRFSSLPGWAQQTLRRHAADPRPHRYSPEQLVAAQTHDPYWNAAMTEMRETGFMHNYMRMYWGKKILEWTADPEEALHVVLTLNNRYFIDGRDPNSYAGAAWIFGKHDQAWQERPVFGKVRTMKATGLERKCNIRAYVDRVNRLTAEPGSGGNPRRA